MTTVLFYESAPDVLTTAPAHMAAHVARWREFAADGRLLMIGTFADVVRDGAMAVFTDRAAAREFASGDPFVVHGVVVRWRLADWRVALAEGLPTIGA